MTPDAAPHDVLALLVQERGWQLQLEGRLPRGYQGAYAVTDQSGRRYVLKWQRWANGLEDSYAERCARLAYLSACGVPIPDVVDAGRAGELWFELQEFVAGELFEQLTAPLLDQLLAVVAAERGAGLKAYGWREWVETWPMEDGHPLASPGAFTHAATRTRQLLDRAQEVVRTSDLAAMRDGDIVHHDFHRHNILTDGDQVTAIVDWADCRDGDASLDLFVLAWEVHLWTRATPDVAARLDEEIAATTPPTVSGFYAAHVCPGSLGWGCGTKWEERIVQRAEEFLTRWSNT